MPREATGRTAVFVGETSDAMAADVQEGADDAVVVADHHDRTAGDVVGEVLARFADIAAQRHQQRHTAGVRLQRPGRHSVASRA